MRLKYLLLLINPIFFISMNCGAQEIRLGAETDYKISKKIKSEFLFQQRFAEHNLQAERSTIIQTKLNYKQNKHFSYALGVRYKNELNVESEAVKNTNDKYRFTGDLIIKIPESIKNTTLNNRLRLQQTFNQNNKHWFIIRNKVSIKYKYSKKFNAGLSYELFYNVSKQAMTLSRLKIKTNYKLSKKLAISPYFIIDALMKNKKFDHYYIIGIHFSYRL